MNIRSRKRKMTGAAVAATGALCVAGAANVLPMSAVAAAESGWASHNVYCYPGDPSTSTSREFIHNVHVYTTDNGTKMDFIRDRQPLDGSPAAVGEPSTVDVTNVGGLGVLEAFNSGGDPDWVCRNWASEGYESGQLTTES